MYYLNVMQTEAQLIRLLPVIIFMSLPGICKAQNGYVITKNDDLIEGYIKYQRNYQDGHLEIEIWKTKGDRNPKKYSLVNIKEYGIKRDTFRIVTEFYPFIGEATYIPCIELKLIHRGKVNLYLTYELTGKKYTPPGLLDPRTYDQPRQKTYILEDQYGKMLAINRLQMTEDLSYFLDYNKYARKLTDKVFEYKQIPALIKLYNSEEK